MAKELKILGIETSCDETAAAVVSNSDNSKLPKILSNVIFSQIKDHSPFGGVVPELAARKHVEILDKIIKRALDQANCNFKDLSAVAVTAGPGLLGGVMVGLITGKAISLAREIPLIGVNHLEGHALSIRLEKKIKFPYLLLLASGGHTEFLIVKEIGAYKRIGTTIDDAAGEAFDKIAKLLKLDFPGGANLEKAAFRGNSESFIFPKPIINSKGCNLSFSGLKTAVAQEISKHKKISMKTAANISASFQKTVTDILISRTANAMEIFKKHISRKEALEFVFAGGVASNNFIKESFKILCRKKAFVLSVPSKILCTDNAAMIAWAGIERFKVDLVDDIHIPPKARWPLDKNAPFLKGSGVKY